MGDIKGFLKVPREDFSDEPVLERIKHYKEFHLPMPQEKLQQQASRCMDCGVPFCQSGCPINNIIPDWNDLVYQNRWRQAIERLHKTNNFPEFTGRVCPAPCENACVLAINKPAVTIKNIEVAIVEKAYAEKWLNAQPVSRRLSQKVAVVGSGPAGLAAADQLNKFGYHVTVYEKEEVVGGLLALGIPDFKLEKWIIERRVKRMREEGIKFKTRVCVGKDILAKDLIAQYDAVVLACGAQQPRDIAVEGRDLRGVHFAMDFLTQQNRLNQGQVISDDKRISAKGKRVIVLGGGDTGSDCIGTSIRQGAVNVKNFELLARPPKQRAADNPWPNWAFIERSSSSHEEGVERDFGILTKKFTGENGVIKKLHAVRVEFGPKDPVTGRSAMKEIPGSEFSIDADLVLLALGFLGPVKSGMIEDLGVALDERGNVKTDANRMTNIDGVFAAGDMRRGQSLVVWAINEGRFAAECVRRYLVLSAKA